VRKGNQPQKAQSPNGTSGNSLNLVKLPSSTSGSTSTCSTVSTTSAASLPSASQIWSKLVSNPAANNQDGTLGLLQMALQDGLMDSILPYMMSSLNLSSANPAISLSSTSQSQPSTGPKSRTASPTGKGSKGSVSSPGRDGTNTKSSVLEKEASRSHTPTPTTTPQPTPTHDLTPVVDDPRPTTAPSTFRMKQDRSPSITIHVCDESRGMRQDFTCPRDLLVQQIGYFADVTAGQRLEDVDISVHCDVSIFEWLLRWVKRGQTGDHDPPSL
ncbi:unnamed protein product, partial [Meganyctiphanes norvegica]